MQVGGSTDEYFCPGRPPYQAFIEQRIIVFHFRHKLNVYAFESDFLDAKPDLNLPLKLCDLRQVTSVSSSVKWVE